MIAIIVFSGALLLTGRALFNVDDWGSLPKK